jgi:hypothetical protein
MRSCPLTIREEAWHSHRIRPHLSVLRLSATRRPLHLVVGVHFLVCACPVAWCLRSLFPAGRLALRVSLLLLWRSRGCGVARVCLSTKAVCEHSGLLLYVQYPYRSVPFARCGCLVHCGRLSWQPRCSGFWLVWLVALVTGWVGLGLGLGKQTHTHAHRHTDTHTHTHTHTHTLTLIMNINIYIYIYIHGSQSVGTPCQA